MDSEGSQIGTMLKTTRERAGLTQVDVARRLGIDSVTLSRYERGVSRAPQPTLIALASIYGEDPSVFGVEEYGDLAHAPSVVGERLADAWAPNPALRNVLPPRAYDIAIGYCRRLAAAGLPREEVEEAERMLIDSEYAKLNRKLKREQSEDDMIRSIDATWAVMQLALGWKGVRA